MSKNFLTKRDCLRVCIPLTGDGYHVLLGQGEGGVEVLLVEVEDPRTNIRC